MPTPKRLYADKLNEIARRFANLDDDTIKRLIGALQQFRKEIAAELMEGGSDFTEFRLRELRGNIDRLVGEFVAQLTPQMRRNFAGFHELGGRAVVNPLQAAGIKTVFFTPSRAQLNAILDFSAELIKDIGEDMRSKINRSLARSVMGQRTPFQAMKEITEILGIKAKDGIWGTRRRPEVVKGVAARAEAIVRSEITRVHNLAHQSQAEITAEQEPGVQKRWVATGDARTRDSHLRIHRDTLAEPIPVGDKFKVGSDELRFPGDPLGTAKETINCRCRMVIIHPDIGPSVTPRDRGVIRELEKRDEK